MALFTQSEMEALPDEELFSYNADLEQRIVWRAKYIDYMLREHTDTINTQRLAKSILGYRELKRENREMVENSKRRHRAQVKSLIEQAKEIF